MAEAYVRALLEKNWAGAYACVHPDSKATCNAEQFARLAEQYRGAFGFELADVVVGSSEEHGGTAIAHVVYRGHNSSGAKYYKDGMTLGRTDAGWGIVLPSNFGRRRAQ
jgi:hypothetical protein